jgi:superfamily II DNA or RNA helicase
MVHRFIGVGKRVLILVPRRELAYQCLATLERFGRYGGVIMAGEERLAGMDFYVASFDTLHARCMQRNMMKLPRADVVIVDEAHLAVSQTRKDIIDAYPDAKVIGFTATPSRPDGKPLGRIFDDLVLGPSIRELTELGQLVPVRYFVGERPNMEGVQVRAGDFNQRQMSERVDQPRLVGDIVTNWLALGEDRQTVVFCVNRKHSRHIAQQFAAQGISCEHLDGDTPTAERADILARIATGQTRIITNCFVMSYGIDVPEIGCIVMSRPTKSVVLYYQSVGRGLRTAEGKDDLILLDHSGCVEQHGFIDEEYPWSLHGNAHTTRERERVERREPKPIECPQCNTIFSATHICPACGFKLSGGTEAVPYHEADLKPAKERPVSMAEKRRFYGELLDYSRRHGYSDGWAAHKYRERFEIWPRLGDVEPVQPRQSTMNWIKSKQIRTSEAEG